MKYILSTFLLVIFVFTLNPNALAQDYKKINGTSTFSSKTSFAEIVAYDKAHPAPGPKMKVPNKEVFKYPEYDIDKNKIIYKAEKKLFGENSKIKSIKEPGPMPDKDFLGLPDNNNSIPPDVNGAAGPDHLMITLNTETRIMDKEGNVISTVSTGSFWHGVPGSGGVFDPKIIYDPYEDRWIYLLPSTSNPSTSALLVAVSENSDPTGNWYRYSFDTDPNDLVWFDYPNFGFNKNWIVISGNMFGGGFYTALFVLDKHDLYNNAAVVDYSRFEINDGFTLVPAKTYDTEEEDIYMVNNAGGNSGGFGYLNLWRVTGGYENEEVENLGYIQIADTWENWSGMPGGNFAPQLGTNQRINTVDARMENMIYRNGKLWTVHHVYLPTNNPTRSAIQWFELGLDGTVLQHGRVDDPDGGMFYAFATIAVNANEDVMVGYGSFSDQQYASGSYSFRYADDPTNTMRDSYQFVDGKAPYWKTFSGDRNRWGDYTGTVVDPVDDLDFWTLQEFADLPGSQDQWSTWWAYVNIDAVPKAEFSSNIVEVPTGSGVNFQDESKYEPSEWKWIFEGGTPSTSTEKNPQNIIYENSGLFDVTLIATNYLGSDTILMEDYINSNTTILPEVNFAVSNTIPCYGDEVQLEDLSIYNPIEWKWEFYPNYVTFVNGTNENSQNPEVIFDLAVQYEITLTATNLNGSNSITITDVINSGGLYLPFDEDFETLSFAGKAWTIENEDDDKTWEIIEVGGTTPGSYAAYVNIKNYNGLTERDRLISPLINLTDYNEASLEFQFAYAQRFPQYTDSLIVYLSSGCGGDLIPLVALGEDSLNHFATVPATTENFIPQSPEEWCGADGNPECVTIDLTEWIGTSDLQFVFETYNGFGNNIFIDNIKIDGTLSDIGESQVTANNFRIYPNPADGSFTVEMSGIQGSVDLTMLNISGQLIFSDKLIGSNSKVNQKYNFDDLEEGVYLIRLTTNTGIYTQKLIIK